VQALEVAVDNFVWRGEGIARDVPEAATDILAAVADIRRTGASTASAARDFTAEPCSPVRRGVLVTAARELLAAVARLLILADMIDVHVLLQSVAATRDDLDFVGRRVASEKELMEGMRRFTASSGRLVNLAGRRQTELKDRQAASGLAAARAVLKKTTPLLYTSCNVHVRYPQSVPAGQNRETVRREICRAVETIGDIAEGKKREGTEGDGKGKEEGACHWWMVEEAEPSWVEQLQDWEARLVKHKAIIDMSFK
jgi:catenin alpha